MSSAGAAALPRTWQKLARDQKKAREIRHRIRRRVARVPAVDPATSAAVAELHYVNDRTMPGIRRIGHTHRVRYVDPHGRTVDRLDVRQRIRSLAIPPAWTDVWICPDPLGHLQATGRDARGRKQYRYHPRWREVRDEVKYGRMLAFAAALPALRARVEADLAKPGLPRQKVLATVVRLLEKTLIRVGNEEYARDNQSFGLTTLRDAHAKVNGTTLRFQFRGKSGISHAIDVQDARLARIVKACRDLPGQELFQYLDDNGERQAIGSDDVNEYLRDVTGQPFTSKDFRTWAATVLVAVALAEVAADRRERPSQRATKAQVTAAIKHAASRLGNTATVCRKCYVHPAVLDAFMNGRTIRTARAVRRASAPAALSAHEAALVALLERAR